LLVFSHSPSFITTNAFAPAASRASTIWRVHLYGPSSNLAAILLAFTSVTDTSVDLRDGYRVRGRTRQDHLRVRTRDVPRLGRKSESSLKDSAESSCVDEGLADGVHSGSCWENVEKVCGVVIELRLSVGSLYHGGNAEPRSSRSLIPKFQTHKES
jgi:hypothetical protein